MSKLRERLIKSPLTYILFSLIGMLIVFLMGEYWYIGASFYADFLSGFLATAMGAILGIPLALWVSDYQEKSVERERKEKILNLISKEIVDNQKILSVLQKSENKRGEIWITGSLLRDEAWRALSDGGELEWIKDPGLIDTLADVYYIIRSIKELSDRYCSILSGNTKEISSITINNVFNAINDQVINSETIFRNATKVIREHMEKRSRKK